jgi:hypothetical protein
MLPILESVPTTLPRALSRFFERYFGPVVTGTSVRLFRRPLPTPGFATAEGIWLHEERFDPDSFDGVRLIAHELEHVVQQREGRVPGTTGRPTVLWDLRSEIDAERSAQRAAWAYALAGRSGTRGVPRRPRMREGRRFTSGCGRIVIQPAIGLEIEIPVPIDRLPPQWMWIVRTIVDKNKVITPANLMKKVEAYGILQRHGKVKYGVPLTTVTSGAIKVRVETDHDDRVLSRDKGGNFVWPPREATDSILEIVMQTPVTTEAELNTSMNLINNIVSEINANTNNLTTRWTNAWGSGYNIGPLDYPPALHPKRPNHNFQGSIQVNVGIDLREFHSMIKWYAQSDYKPSSAGATDADAFMKNQRSDIVKAVDVGRAIAKEIAATLTPAQRASAGKLRGLRGWMTYMALQTIRGDYATGGGGANKNLLPMLVKSKNDQIFLAGMTQYEKVYYHNHKKQLLDQLQNHTNRVMAGGTQVFQQPGAPPWSFNEMMNEKLKDAALVPTGSQIAPSSVGPVRGGNVEVSNISDDGERQGMVVEFRSLRDFYDGPANWRKVAMKFLKEADLRNQRSGLAP